MNIGESLLSGTPRTATRDGHTLVSILMATYNHAPYIEQAMESCLSQKTSFPFELVVCDDASTDGTSDIVRKWADQHPNLVFILQPVNGRGANNYLDGFRHVRSKYIAFCEGDDYWGSPYKLEKQVRFLEENPDFSVCCHKVEMQFEHGPRDDKKHYIYKDCSSEDERIRQGIFHADEAIANYYFQTSSFVLRWRFSDGLPPWFRKWMMFDHALLMLHAVQGKIKYFDESLSVWRRNETGYSWLQNVDKGVFFQKEGYGWIMLYEEMDQFFSKRFHLQIRERILLALRGMLANCLETGDLASARKIIEDHQEWCLPLAKDNAALFEAVRLAFPEKLNRVPPWSNEPLAETASAPDPTLGGFKEVGLTSIPETPDSAWAYWTNGEESACFASATAATIAWIFHRRVRRLWIPVLAPIPLREELDRLWLPYQFYPMGGDFSPSSAFVEHTLPGDAILTLTYMGRAPAPALRKALAARDAVLWIDDRSQALWNSAPHEADVTIYSPSDILGTPDGGILVGHGVALLQPDAHAENTLTDKRLSLMLERLEHPAIDQRLLAREAALRLENPLPGGPMSRFSIQMLTRIPLADLTKRSQGNWEALRERLGEWALWPELRATDFAPTIFPMRLPESIPPVFMSTALNRLGIICTSFGVALPAKYQGTLGEEVELLKRLLCLPCDHRYSRDDMLRITREVLRILRGESDLGSAGSRFTP